MYYVPWIHLLDTLLNNNKPELYCDETHKIPFSRPIAKGISWSDMYYVPWYIDNKTGCIVVRPMKYLSADILQKVFHGLICIIYLGYT
jgi:hypothetical protein